MDKKYQVFISSTYTDLVEARMKVRDAILSMYHFPVGMELFGAANEEQWQIISETIDSSDYYVLIIGQRYGTLIPEGFPDAGISYTEKEFRYALEKGIPVLAFLLDDSVAVKPEYVETENREKLAAFKESVKTGRLVEWWKTTDELAQKVTAALYKQITRTKRPGWIRGDAVDIEKSLKAITELTERNQQLAEENKALLAENLRLKQRSERMPNLILDLEKDMSDEEEEPDPLFSHKEYIRTEDGVIHLKVGSVGTAVVEAEYLPLKKEDFLFELSGQVSEDEIEAYNNALPSEEEMESYIKLYCDHHRIVDHGIAAVLSIHNIGTAKATDVSVTIEFPDEVRVYDMEDVRKMKEPQAPKKPRNLQEVAYERAHRSEIAMEKAYAQIAQLGSSRHFELPDLSPFFVHDTVSDRIDIFDNMIDIGISDGILHTRWDNFRGIYLVPMKKGEFQAKATFMCAEYEDPKEVKITFVCE